MTRSRFSGWVVVLVATYGLRDLVRGAAPLIPPPSAPSLRSYFELVGGGLLVALALALWTGRGVRPLVAMSFPVVLITTVLTYHEAMLAYGVEPWSARGLLLWPLSLGIALLLGSIAQWMWREAPAMRRPDAR